MNKYLFNTLFVLSIAGNCYAEENENSLELVAQNYNTSISDLSLKQSAWVALSALGGAGGTYLGKKALENIFNTPDFGESNPVKFFDLTQWSLTETIVTPLGSAFFASIMMDYYKPEKVATEANKNGLLNLILESTTAEEIQTALDEKFVIHRFPRSQAFAELAGLRTTIIHLIDLITEHNANRSNPDFKKIKSALNANLKKVDFALLVLKKDSRWFEECNAHTLNRAQGTQETQQKAEFAGAAINLAHAYANAR